MEKLTIFLHNEDDMMHEKAPIFVDWLRGSAFGRREGWRTGLPRGTTPGTAAHIAVHMNGAPGVWGQGLDSHHNGWLLCGPLAESPPLALRGHQL